jgi:hypothetical protein
MVPGAAGARYQNFFRQLPAIDLMAKALKDLKTAKGPAMPRPIKRTDEHMTSESAGSNLRFTVAARRSRIHGIVQLCTPHGTISLSGIFPGLCRKTPCTFLHRSNTFARCKLRLPPLSVRQPACRKLDLLPLFFPFDFLFLLVEDM